MSNKSPKNVAKTRQNNECKICHYTATKLSDLKKHLLTKKHCDMSKLNISNNNIESNVATLGDKKTIKCDNCNKVYTARSSLWYHRKKCINPLSNQEENVDFCKVTTDQTKVSTETQIFSELLTKLVEQNNEFIKQIVELQKNSTSISSGNNINVTNNVNSNNFNLNIFLNEKCKDAINLTDFVDSLVLGISDLEETARLGYANGITKIFINGLNKLDVCKRPLHCSDLKRNTIYIKDDNQWTKETDDKLNLTKAIKEVSNKNIKNIFEWQKKNPEYSDYNSKQNDKYNKIICEAMSGSSKEEQINNYERIIKNISKEIVIDKDHCVSK
jgi:hypothetical protein